MNYDIIALGELLIDFVPGGCDATGDAIFIRKAGGAPPNLLGAAAKFGLKTGMICRVGNDMHGRFLIDTLASAGIDTSAVSVDTEHDTTLAFVTLYENGERDFSFYRKNNADLQLSVEDVEKNADKIRAARVFHLGSLSLCAEPAASATRRALAIAKEVGCIITYDPNYRAPLWDSEETATARMREVLPYVSVIKAAKEEAAMLTGLPVEDVDGSIAALQKMGVKIVLITDGPNGSRAGVGSARFNVPAEKVNSVDTTGAGDIFFGTFLTCLLKSGLSLSELDGAAVEPFVKKAAHIAALSTCRHGGIASVPESLDA